MQIVQIRHHINSWFEKYKRELPWRQVEDPYLIWLTEIILQQTRVDQGLPYFQKIAKKFPTVKDLALATEQEVLKSWQGLGYYSRARNLHAAAKKVVQEHQGQIPTTYKSLLKLPGIGDYTAAAIASIAFGEVQAAVDGNVYRVLSRIFGIRTPTDTTKGKKEFRPLAQELVDPEQPGEFNQAMMDFGALQCKPVNPLCDSCPVQSFCYAYATGTQKELPVKQKRQQQTRKRYFHYLLLRHPEGVFLQRRTGKDIWKNLWELPLIETSMAQQEAAEKLAEAYPTPTATVVLEPEANYQHNLSHQIIEAYFYQMRTETVPEWAAEWTLVKYEDLKHYPLPKLIENFLKKNL